MLRFFKRSSSEKKTGGKFFYEYRTSLPGSIS